MKRISNYKKRITSLAVVICFLLTLIPQGVSAAVEKPNDLTPLYVDDFADGILADNIGTERFYTGDPADTLTEENGKLVFNRQKWVWNTDKEAGEPGVLLYANSDHSPVNGKIFTEFTLSKTREVVRLRFCDSKGNYLVQIAWEGDNFKFSWRDSTLASQSKALTVSAKDSVKISLYSDVSSKTPRFYMWIDDVLQIDGGISQTELSAANFSYIKIYSLLYSSYSKAGTFTVSDFGIWSVNENGELPPEINEEDEKIVDADLALVKKEDILSVPLAGEYLIDALEIDNIKTGINGSEIEWISSDENIISTDGKITRPEEDTSVTLTAKVTCGSVTKEKEFTFNVAGKSTNANGIPGNLTPVYYDGFDDGEISSNIETQKFYTDSPADTLVEENGKLTFTRNKYIWYSDAAYGEPAVRFYSNSDKTSVSGKTLIEYTLSKTREVVRMRVCDSKYNYLTQIYWAGNSFTITYRDEDFNTKTKDILINADETVKVSIYADLTGPAPLFSLWVNNEKVLDNVYSATNLQNGSLSFFQLYTLIHGNYSKNGSFTMDNVGFYSVDGDFTDEEIPEPPVEDGRTNEERVNDDLALIDDSVILSVPKTDDGYILDNLDIDAVTQGENGSVITWKSSDESIISSDGKLSRPMEDTDVTLTATAQFGDASAEKSFTYTVAGLSTDIDGMITNRFPLFFDDFSDGEINENIKSRNLKNSDKFDEKNGKLVLKTTSWASHEPGFTVYRDSNLQAMTGKTIMEFTLSKTCDVVRMRSYCEKWNYMNQIYWVKDNFNIYYVDGEGNTKTLTLNIPAKEKAKVTIYSDITSSTPKFTMWVNNKKVLEDVSSCMSLSPASIQFVNIYAINHGDYGKTGDTVVDNFGYYSILPEMEDDERVEADAKLITDESLIKTSTPLVGYAFEDLNLPSYGQNGSRITWTSSNEDLVSVDGKVTRDDDENISVTLKAEISFGSAKITKDFNIIILGMQVDTTDVPGIETMITEYDFESDETPGLIGKNLAGGGSVEIADGALVAQKTGDGTSQLGTMVYTGLDEMTSASGVIGIEYDIEREKNGIVQIRSMDANGGVYYSVAWGSSGMSAYYSTDPQVQGTSRSVWKGSSNKIHVNMMFDTANSTYWLWVDGTPAVVEKYSRSVGVGSLCYTLFYLEGKNTIKIDNYKIYNAIPPKALRLKFDNSAFGESELLNEIPQAGNIIKSSVNLPTLLRYGTTVRWESSREDIIDPETGKVTRPTGEDENPLVTLTAYMENSGIDNVREFTYRVLRDFGDDDNLQQKEAEDIMHSYLTKEDPNQIKTSLNLMDTGLYGSQIIWTSSNTSVITNSGRVIRPRFTEEDKKVTLTAQIGNYKKELEFTVVKDEAPKDPMHTSDEEFFGLWNGTSYTKGPQLDYSNPELSAIEECAKIGDYEGAKEALLKYFKQRDIPSPLRLGTRYSGWVDARCDGVFELGEGNAYYRGHMVVDSDDYQQVTASLVNASAISKIECKTFELLARYNEATSAFVLGTDADNPNMVPKLELTVNGAVRTYKATHSATIRAGKYSRTHVEGNKELQVKMFGDFLGDETYRILLGFDLSDLGADDKITAAQLTVYAKKSSKSAESKHLWIMDNKNKAWNEDTIYWDGLNFTFHNYNGLIGGSDWKGARSSDVEFAYQMPRFGHSRSTMTEYKYTGNEKYAYALLTQVLDLITDTGNKTPYPRSLDAALRMQEWVPLMNTFIDSPYMTKEFATAFMKYMYSQFEYFPSRKEATGNWRDYEQLAVLYATSAYPELANSASTKEICIWSWQNAFNKSYMSDGTYIEDTGGYNTSSFAMYRDFKKACVESGTKLPEEFDRTLHNAVYYMCLTRGPGGLTLQYGDEGGNKFGANSYSEVTNWYNDYELRFIDSQGTTGVEPSWTSYQFPEGRYTMMRSDWKNDAIYLHTSVRGSGGGHGHYDDNSIILIANGKRLLVDAGKMTYNNYDASRIYGQSTQGHNTVVINDTNQRGSWTGNEFNIRGNINRWTTNSHYDFLSQTTIAYAEHSHTRNILFIKDGLFVVSDLMEPNDKTKENNYKQYWHMAPAAGISADEENKLLLSNYDDGKNLIISSGDEIDISFEDGYYDIADGTPTGNKAGIFEKSLTGDATFDTVLYVTDYHDAKVSTERLETGKPASEATALKINAFENKKSETYYYMYNHKYTGEGEISFGDFTTDARAALICTDADGNITRAVMTDGTSIKKNGKDVIATENKVTNISAKHTASKITVVSTDEELEAEDIKLISGKNTKSVLFNGVSKEFENAGGVIQLGSKEAQDVEITDSNKNDGIGERPSGGGSGGGNSGGGYTPVIPSEPVQVYPFTDIKGHWAAEYIVNLYTKGIVNGNSDGTYKPDNAISRCEFIAIAIRALGIEKSEYSGGFEDLKSGDWFANDVQTAIDLGIISADSVFRPHDNITREEMAKIISGCAKHLGIEDSKNEPVSFSDTQFISDWAKEYVDYVSRNGIMNGKDGNMFDPKGNATRAETATVFSRLTGK